MLLLSCMCQNTASVICITDYVVNVCRKGPSPSLSPPLAYYIKKDMGGDVVQHTVSNRKGILPSGQNYRRTAEQLWRGVPSVSVCSQLLKLLLVVSRRVRALRAKTCAERAVPDACVAFQRLTCVWSRMLVLLFLHEASFCSTALLESDLQTIEPRLTVMEF